MPDLRLVARKGSPSWLAYDLRVMFQGFVELGFSTTEDQAARFSALPWAPAENGQLWCAGDRQGRPRRRAWREGVQHPLRPRTCSGWSFGRLETQLSLLFIKCKEPRPLLHGSYTEIARFHISLIVSCTILIFVDQGPTTTIMKVPGFDFGRPAVVGSISAVGRKIC